MSSTNDAAKHHVHQLLMSVYQAYLQDGLPPAEARGAVGRFLNELLAEWPPVAQLYVPRLSPLPVLRRAVDECRTLGTQGANLMRTLIDLQNMLGGK